MPASFAAIEGLRDLPRSLLPLGGESCRQVYVPEPMSRKQVKRRDHRWPTYSDYLDWLPKWKVRIIGLLPIEQTVIRNAVPGGDLTRVNKKVPFSVTSEPVRCYPYKKRKKLLPATKTA